MSHRRFGLAGDLVPILSCESPGSRVPDVPNKETQDTGDKILSEIATLIQSSPAVNWRLFAFISANLFTSKFLAEKPIS